MKSSVLLLTHTFVLSFLAWVGPVLAQAFNTGSTGAYGALNITKDTTLDLPPDGIYNCTTINVAAGATLRFKRNALNTPVYLLATGAVTITGTIDVSGEGYDSSTPGAGGPGGFDGGFAGFGSGASAIAGDGHGPGGGRNVSGIRNAAFGAASQGNANVYGNALLSPLVGGSGGAGGSGSPGAMGGGGGGAVLIASPTKILLAGAVTADGGGGYRFSQSAGGGSGGGVRLVAPLVTGTGVMRASGGYSWEGSASPGRIRIDTLDRYAYRGLGIQSGLFSHGVQMIALPLGSSRLDIVQVGDQVIPLGTTSLVSLTLPPGPATNVPVTLRASGFTNNVAVRVVVAPESGPSVNYDDTIATTGNPATTTLSVQVPAGTISRIYAWSR